MKIRIALISFLSALLTACGGGGSGGSGAGGSGAGNTTGDSSGGLGADTFRYVSPTQGQTLTYSDVTTDVAGTSITYPVVDVITKVNADGSFSMTEGPVTGTQAGYPLDGGYWQVDLVDYSYDNRGAATQWSDTTITPNTPVCKVSESSGAAPSSMTKGQSYAEIQTTDCGDGLPATDSGTVTYLGTETVTVPAGTFSTFKFQYVGTTTSNSVLTQTTTRTFWRNTSLLGGMIVKGSVNLGNPIPSKFLSIEKSTSWELVSYK